MGNKDVKFRITKNDLPVNLEPGAFTISEKTGEVVLDLPDSEKRITIAEPLQHRLAAHAQTADALVGSTNLLLGKSTSKYVTINTRVVDGPVRSGAYPLFLKQLDDYNAMIVPGRPDDFITKDAMGNITEIPHIKIYLNDSEVRSTSAINLEDFMTCAEIKNMISENLQSFTVKDTSTKHPIVVDTENTTCQPTDISTLKFPVINSQLTDIVTFNSLDIQSLKGFLNIKESVDQSIEAAKPVIKDEIFNTNIPNVGKVNDILQGASIVVLGTQATQEQPIDLAVVPPFVITTVTPFPYVLKIQSYLELCISDLQTESVQKRINVISSMFKLELNKIKSGGHFKLFSTSKYLFKGQSTEEGYISNDVMEMMARSGVFKPIVTISYSSSAPGISMTCSPEGIVGLSVDASQIAQYESDVEISCKIISEGYVETSIHPLPTISAIFE